MKLADLKLRIDGLVAEHGIEILQEPLFVQPEEDGGGIATELCVVVATHSYYDKACKDAGFNRNGSKIAVVLS